MRNDARQNATINDCRTAAGITHIQSYHSTDNWQSSESYAFQGFKKGMMLRTSDRFVKLETDDEGIAHRVDGQDMRAVGIEIETECNGISNYTVLAEVCDKIIFSAFPEGLFKMQSDSSLGGNSSVEIISCPMTKEAVRNLYKPFRTMFDVYFPAFQISADSFATSCGMHVNLSTALFGSTEAKQEENIKKLLYVVNHFYDFFAALFYRSPRRTTWCGRMSQFDNKERCKAARLDRFPNDHGLCLNLSHIAAGRVEIRLVGGQKNFACFRNTMEAVFQLLEGLKKTDWEKIDDLANLFRGCNQYVFDRISTYCRERGTIDAATVERIGRTVKRVEFI